MLKNELEANDPKKQAGVAILISNKIDFQPKVIKKDGESHYIFIKGKNLPRWTLNFEHLCYKCKDIIIHSKKITKDQSTHCSSGLPMEELEKVPKEIKGSATL